MPRRLIDQMGPVRATRIGVHAGDVTPGRIYATCARCGLVRLVRTNRPTPEMCQSCKASDPHWGKQPH